MTQVYYYYAEQDTTADGRTYFRHIFGNRRAVESCVCAGLCHCDEGCCPKDRVVKIAAREVDPAEATEDHYWAWEDTIRPGTINLVWFAEQSFRCCFAYGVEAAVKEAKGRVVRLAIEEAERQS